MSITVKTPPRLQSLRDTVEWLREEGLLLETDVEVDPDLEITGIQKHLDGSYPILFRRVKGYPDYEVVTNLFANMDVVDRLFGWDGPQDRTRKLAHAITHPIPPVEVPQEEAPCQEEVITTDLEVNRYVVAIRHTELESERTIGSGNSVVVGPYFRGGSHIGYNRMNARWGNVCTFQAAPGSHMWQVITEHYHDDRPIPLTAKRAKPAVPFGAKYRIIDFVLNNFVNSGIYSIYVLTQFKAQSLTEHIQRYWRFGAFLEDHFILLVPAQMYRYEELGPVWYRGTADAIYQNLHLVQNHTPRAVAVFGGDHIFKMNIRHMVEYHYEKRADITIAAYPVPVEEARRFGVLQVDEDWRITEFQEKPQNQPCPNVGQTMAGHRWGDVDCSGSVDVADAQKVLRYILGLPVQQGPGCLPLGSVVPLD